MTKLFLFFLTHLWTILAHSFSTSVVTGANGYVGRAVVRELIEKTDHNVVCLVRPARVESEKNYWDEEPFVKVLPYDYLDGGESLEEALVACSGERICVYHVASVFGPTDDHEETARNNVQGTKDMCNVLGKRGNCRLILTSSMAAVRGTGQDPKNGKFYTSEDWNTSSELGANWGSSYQWSKAESEKIAWEMCKELDVPMTSLCPSFVFGPPTDASSTNSYSLTLVGQWARGESPVQSRLFVDVRDVATAHVQAGLSDKAVGQRYILSQEERIESSTIADWLSDVSDPEKIHFDSEFTGGAIAIGEKEVESASRLEQDFGLVLRPVKETIVDMAKILLEQN